MTTSTTSFIISIASVQMLAELLGPHIRKNKASFIRCLFTYHLDLVLILFAFYNSSSRASCVS